MVSPGHIKQLLTTKGLDPKVAEPVAESLHALFSRFAADERLNYDVIEKNLGGTGTRGSTLLVAADDALDRVKEAADFVCDGVSDEATIQEAIDLISNPANTTYPAGSILLSEGEFNLSNPVLFDFDLDISGFGPIATRINVPIGDTAFELSGLNKYFARLRNMGFWGSTGTCIDAQDTWGWTVENCYFDSISCAIKGTPGSSGSDPWANVIIRRNLFSGCGDTGIYAVDLDLKTGAGTRGLFGFLFHENRFRTAAGAGDLRLHVDTLVERSSHQITDNVFVNDVSVENVAALQFANNTCIQPVLFTNTDLLTLSCNYFGDLTLVNVDVAAIAACIADGTYTETTCTGIVKAGNSGIV